MPSALQLARSAPGTPAPVAGAGGEDGGGDGDRTPEGQASSSSEASDGNAEGPVLDIFGPEQAQADDADSGAAAAALAAAAEDAERERQLHAVALLQHHTLGKGPSGHDEAGPSAARDRSAARPPSAPATAGQGAAGAAAAAPQADEDDMFAERDDEDLFGGDVAAAAVRAAPAAGAAQLHDSYDDAEGYYNFQVPRGVGWGRSWRPQPHELGAAVRGCVRRPATARWAW